MKIPQAFLSLLIACTAVGVARASISLPASLEENSAAATAIFHGTVLKNQSYRNPADGVIYTRTTLRVDETFKGRCPGVITVVHRGGAVEGVGLLDDSAPRFQVGEERLLFVSRRADRTLFAAQGENSARRLHRGKGGALVGEQADWMNTLRRRGNLRPAADSDVTDQAGDPALSPGAVNAPSGDTGGVATNGLLIASDGLPTRFPLPDRGEPIPYLVDATALPAGITLPQALNAVSNAMSAWARASSFRFAFAGTANFGNSADAITNNDGYFRIQLHDSYHVIAPGNVLGVGGSWFTIGLLPGANWGPGGKVSGMEFNRSLNGYVVLQHTNVAMQNLATFTEVLTHEVGHVIGLAHSSEIATNNATLSDSIMFFQAHADGRGAQINSYDTNVVRVTHPTNAPPFLYDRVLDVVDSSPQPNLAGVNEVDLRGYDLQSTSLTLNLTNLTSSYGLFSMVGTVVRYTPYAGTLGDGPRLDPAGNGYYDVLYARFVEGTNASTFVTLRVISFNYDSVSPTDGVPDSWMTANFGHANPQIGDSSFATNNPDGDTLTNFKEYVAGMDPKSKASAQLATIYKTNVIQWQAKAYELYEIQAVTNLVSTNWTRVGNPVLPVSSTGSFTNYYNPAAPTRLFRVFKVP